MTAVAATAVPAGTRARQSPLRIAELPLALLLMTMAAVWAQHTQRYEVFRYWDSDEYFLMTTQLAAHEPVAASAPYTYRVLVPWLVARLLPGDVQSGFLYVNLLAGGVVGVLLLVWLRRSVASVGFRLLMLSAYAFQWHGPLRFTFYYPVYVDPVFQAFVLAALLLGDVLLERPSLAAGLSYVALAVPATLCREAFLIAPIALLLGGVAAWRRSGSSAAVWWPTLAIVTGGLSLAAAVWTATNVRPSYSFLETVGAQISSKPLESILLAWFITFGPMLAVVVYDLRATLGLLARRVDLAAFLGGCALLAYVGGQDTERLLFWAMPVAYLLVARSMERHRRRLSLGVAALLVAGQLLSQRVLWPIPTPITAVTPWATDLTWPARVYAVLNRMFVIDDFHWNLYSNFGSRPSHLLQLAFYLLLSAAILALMSRRDGRIAAEASA